MSGENCLAGLKILDLTQFEAGPSCTEALAWLGADVVKIENPGSGDPGRSIGRTSPDADALYFLQYNSNKRSAAINLKDPRGLELVKRLAKCADVMIENFAPGAIERLGLGYEAIKAVNPAIIYCQVKGFGTGSPFEKNLAFDMIAQASGGLMSITGEEDGKPCKAGATVGDTGTGMVMAISILAAYVRCLRTGQGEHLVVGMQDSVMHYIRNAFAHMDRSDGKAAPRIGSRTVGGGQPPIGVYPSKGGGPNDYVYIYAGAASPEHWNRLLKAMGREDLIGDTRYSTAAARLERRAEVDEIVANWTRQFDKHTVMRLVGATAPAGAVLDTREIADDPTFEQRKIRQTMAHPVIGNYTMSGWPVRFGDAPPAVAPAPLLGQHSGNVLADWLKMDDIAIGTLREAKVIAGDVPATAIAAE